MAAVVAAKVKRNRDSGRGGSQGRVIPRPTPGVGAFGPDPNDGPAGGLTPEEAERSRQKLRKKLKPNPSAEYYKRVNRGKA